MKKKSKLRKICGSNLWFLLGALLFLIGGIRYLIQGDDTGAIIYFLAAFLFSIGYLGRIKFSKPKK